MNSVEGSSERSTSSLLSTAASTSFVWRSTLLAAGISASSGVRTSSTGGGRSVVSQMRENRAIKPVQMHISEEKWRRTFDECYETELTRIRSAWGKKEATDHPGSAITSADRDDLSERMEDVATAHDAFPVGIPTPQAWSVVTSPEVSPARVTKVTDVLSATRNALRPLSENSSFAKTAMIRPLAPFNPEMVSPIE